MAVTAFVAACGIEDMGEAGHSNVDGVWTGYPVADPENICYAVVFDYEDGYDWRSDPEKGTARCSLVLLAAGVPVLKMPVGDKYEVSSDAERHRVIAGVLYSDHSDGNTTVLKADGRELYRYQGAETVERILMHDGHVHTLCYPKESAGFSYRVDGELRLQRSEAQLFEHMSSCNDTVTFYFMQPVSSSQGVEDRYYKVQNGAVTNMEMKGISKVWDICHHKDETCMIATYSDEKAPVMICGDTTYKVNYFSYLNILYCRFLESERICANLRCIHTGPNYMTDFLWLGDDGYDSYRFAEPLSAIYADALRTYACINPSEGRQGLIFYGSKAYYMPEGYHTRGADAIAVAEDVMYVALASDSGGKPLIWKNGQTDTLNVNGYIASLAVYRD